MKGYTFPEMVANELQSARRKHRPINSVHEGYAVLLEEVEEFWEEVRKKRENRNSDRMVEELVQVATMAQRIAEDALRLPEALIPQRGGR